MEVKVCTKCKTEYPATNKYFGKSKTCAGGLNSQCKQCINKRYRERYKFGIYTSGHKLEIEEKMKREQEAFERMINEEVTEGLDLSKLKLDKQKKYKIDRKKNDRGDYERHLVGYIVQETKELVTFRSETGYCESFRKGCLMCGDYRAKEV